MADFYSPPHTPPPEDEGIPASSTASNRKEGSKWTNEEDQLLREAVLPYMTQKDLVLLGKDRRESRKIQKSVLDASKTD
jgi:hypothetical protein